MGYRDELAATKLRLERAEQELDAARSEIDLLRGGRGARTSAKKNALLGGPTRLLHVVEVPGELSEDGYERLVAALREEIESIGSLDRVGGSLAWRAAGAQNNRQLAATVRVVDTTTEIRLDESLRPLVGSMFGGFGGGIGGGFTAPIVILSSAAGLPEAALPFVGAAWLVGVLVGAAWLVGVLATVRAMFTRITNKREAQLDALAARLERIAREDIAGRDRSSELRVRVGGSSSARHAEEQASDEREEGGQSLRRMK